jgi:hypothetical protein
VDFLQPAVSIGNAGQLAVDLLVSTLGVRRAGFLEEPHVLPCVGNDPFGPSAEGKLTVALEGERENPAFSGQESRATGSLGIAQTLLLKEFQESFPDSYKHTCVSLEISFASQ